jgi:hypothetical protein
MRRLLFVSRELLDLRMDTGCALTGVPGKDEEK